MDSYSLRLPQTDPPKTSIQLVVGDNYWHSFDRERRRIWLILRLNSEMGVPKVRFVVGAFGDGSQTHGLLDAAASA